MNKVVVNMTKPSTSRIHLGVENGDIALCGDDTHVYGIAARFVRPNTVAGRAAGTRIELAP